MTQVMKPTRTTRQKRSASVRPAADVARSLISGARRLIPLSANGASSRAILDATTILNDRIDRLTQEMHRLSKQHQREVNGLTRAFQEEVSTLSRAFREEVEGLRAQLKEAKQDGRQVLAEQRQWVQTREELLKQIRERDRRIDEALKQIRERDRRINELQRRPDDWAAHATTERLNYQNAEIYLRVTTRSEQKRRSAATKEPWTVEWIEQFVQPGEVLYDIGANVGAYALIAAKKSQAKVVAFEPSYANFASMCDNIVLNDLGEQIIPLPIGLSAKTELGRFSYLSLAAGTSYSTLADVSPIKQFEPAYRQPCLTYSLDDLVEQFDLPPPHHVKIDVDGLEIDVLAGAERTLRLPTFKSLMLEIFVEQTDEVIRQLEGFGLVLREKHQKSSSEGPRIVWYGLFTPANVAVPTTVNISPD